MIGVAFSLEGTLAITPGLARAAFERLCTELGEAGGRRVPLERIHEAYAEFGIESVLLDRSQARTRVARAALSCAGASALTDTGVLARFVQLAAIGVREHTIALPEVARVLAEVESLAMPRAIVSNGFGAVTRSQASALNFSGTVVSGEDLDLDVREPAAFARLAAEIALPAQRIWFVSRDAGQRHTAESLGFNVVARVEDLLETIKEPYTRSLLALRYVMRSALEWRPGHALTPEDVAE